MSDFLSFGLPMQLNQAIERVKFSTPTPIQAMSIPIALEGKDILGSAQTGTGKTAAFAIPLLANIYNDKTQAALILTPTRELAIQVLDSIQQLLPRNSNIGTALLIGGEPMPKQFRQLDYNPRIIVGTPGRINDHLSRGSLDLSQTNFLVLDETDRMLDMGFGIQLDQIVQYLPEERQTLMFSATMPGNIMKLANKYLNAPEKVSTGQTNAPAANLKQEIIHTSDDGKYGHLIEQINQREGSIVVFVKTKRGAEKLADRLNGENIGALAMHGDLQQRKRERVIESFRRKKQRIMVATDVAARGLDIPHIRHVINYNLPECPEDYIHRIGRTARAGAEGSAVCFIDSGDFKDKLRWRAIERLLNPNANNNDKDQDVGFSRDRNFSGNRDGQRRGDKKPFGRSFGGGFSNKPRGERSSERSSERGGFGRSSSSERNFNSFDKPRGERSFERSSERSSERGGFGRPSNTGKSFASFDKPRGERNFERTSERSSERSGFGRSSSTGKSFGSFDKPRGERSSERSGNSRSEGKSFGSRSSGSGKSFGKSFGAAGGSKPGGKRPVLKLKLN